MFCADDVNLLGEKINITIKKIETLLVASKDVDIETNAENNTDTGGMPDENSTGKFINCHPRL